MSTEPRFQPQNQRAHNPNLRRELIDAGLIRERIEPPFTPIPPVHLAPHEDEPPPFVPRRRRRR